MNYIIASENNIELLMKIRLEMLRVVNNLTADYQFDESIVNNARKYFIDGSHTTVLAVNEYVIGCATMCYIEMMPTFSHPTGKRAHLMNVYTASEYRRQGIALKMLEILIDTARKNGVTQISLDATEAGRPLYKKAGFNGSDEYMVMDL